MPIVKVKGSLKSNIAFWEPTGASRFICDTIVDGIISPLFTPHPQRALAIIDLTFSIVNLWSKLFLITGSVCVGVPLLWLTPLSVSI